MKLLKNILCGVLIATAVSTLSAMDMHGVKPIIDCYEINTKEALVNALKHHGYIEDGFTADNVWQGIPECVNDVWKRLDEPSKKSILDAHIRIDRATTLVTPGGSANDKKALIDALNKKFPEANDELDRRVVNLPFGKQIKEWIIANKWKTAGIGAITVVTLDGLQAYARTDKTTWNESDLKGKLELIRRKMMITRSFNGTCGFIKSRCA